MRQNQLHLDEKLKNRLPNNAIDNFFQSLATEQGKLASAVILSCTGTDGTRGIEAIKAAGGTVIVQDPMSAAFDGMPNSAIASGFADMVLPPELIPDELIDYIRETPLQRSLIVSNQKDEAILMDILHMLQQVAGHDFTNYKRPTLFRRLSKRMNELSIPSLEDYRRYLHQQEAELKILAREFLINVTKFFRDTEAFDLIRTQVIPAIFNSKEKDEIIKVWSMACSSGEEAYSLAILFHEYGTETTQGTAGKNFRNGY